MRVYHSDRLGSVRWVTDGSQNILVSYVYEGFGKIVGQNGGGGGPYQFCGLWGYRNDWDAGLMHVGARYYEVETGRWVQKDKWLGDIFQTQSLNLFVYCLNRPTELIDPLGLQWWKVWLIIRLVIVILTNTEEIIVTRRPPPRPPEPPVAVGPFPIIVIGIFKETAEYAAEEFWEGREETGGILHSIIAARSGVLDLWME